MNQLPTINKATQAAEQVVAKPPRKIDPPKLDCVTIDLPMMDQVFEGYFSNRVDVKLTGAHQAVLKSLLFGLQSKFAKLANGKQVANASDAIKWILENVK
jgi:hypothetical protein